MKWSHNALVIAKVKTSDDRQTYSGLLWWQKNSRYKPGWAYCNFIKIYDGRRPNFQSAVEPQPPNNDLREYLGIMRKRYRQKKKREEVKNGRTILPLETPR